MSKENAYAVGMFAVMILLVASLVYMWYIGSLDLVIMVVVAIIVVFFFVGAIMYLVLGTYYFFKKKDKAEYNSSMGLGDVVEVDREMEKKN